MTRYWAELRPFLTHRARLALLVLGGLSLLAGVAEAILLVLVVNGASAVAGGGDAASVPIPLIADGRISPGAGLVAAAALGVVAVGAHVVVARLSARVAGTAMRSARERAIRAFSGASWARQALEREGALQHTITTLSEQSAQMTVQAAGFLAGSLGLGALLGVALVVDPAATVVVLAFGAMLFGVLAPVRRLTQRRAGRFVDGNNDLAERTSQWSALAMESRVFGVAGIEADRMLAENRTTAQRFTASRFVAQAGSLLFRDLAILFIVAAVSAVYLLGEVNLASIGSVVILIVRGLSYAQGAQGSLQALHEFFPNLAELTRRIESLEADRETFGSAAIAALGPLDVVDVAYEYDDGVAAIENVSLAIIPGEAIGVIGPSGGGKSTLVQVLLRLRPPTRGYVRVEGLDYTEIAPDSWSRLVALVPQEPQLFSGTVADNIGFHRPWISRERIERAAADAHVLDEILRLPDGFDTVLGPRGSGLSGGQRQRIAIARALAGDPSLLVLDEPTSALDVRSEQLLRETIAALHGRVTLVIVAHRISTLTICDRVVAMADGRVVTIGTLEEALAHVDFDRAVGDGPPADASAPGP